MPIGRGLRAAILVSNLTWLSTVNSLNLGLTCHQSDTKDVKNDLCAKAPPKWFTFGRKFVGCWMPKHEKPSDVNYLRQFGLQDSTVKISRKAG